MEISEKLDEKENRWLCLTGIFDQWIKYCIEQEDCAKCKIKWSCVTAQNGLYKIDVAFTYIGKEIKD